jgi:hypothetical protein
MEMILIILVLVLLFSAAAVDTGVAVEVIGDPMRSRARA